MTFLPHGFSFLLYTLPVRLFSNFHTTFGICRPSSSGINYFQFDSTKMNYSQNVPSYDQNGNLSPVSQSPSSSSASFLTRDQEHGIMVSALRQVISNISGSGMSSNSIACEALPSPDTGPCPPCGITGCYGCAFQQGHTEKKRKEEA